MRRLLLPDRFNGISLLADVATELLTHPDKSTVDVARSRTHAGGSCQCYKRDINRYSTNPWPLSSLQPRNHSRQFVTPVRKLNGFIGSNGRYMLRGSAGQRSRMSSKRVQP